MASLKVDAATQSSPCVSRASSVEENDTENERSDFLHLHNLNTIHEEPLDIEDRQESFHDPPPLRRTRLRWKDSDTIDALDSDTASTDIAGTGTSKGGDSAPRRRRIPFPRLDTTSEFSDELDRIFSMPRRAAEEAEEFVKRVWAAGWRVVHHRSLPDWMKDNDFLVRGHRPQLNSVKACFKSIFRIHTETGNIWTHLVPFVMFIAMAIYFNSRPHLEIRWEEKAVFSAFFVGAIICLGCSWTFHTMCCHSYPVSKLFNKLDYCGISVMIVGSFIPWLYYSFYCRHYAQIVYGTLIMVLGIASIIVSLFNRFSEPRYRPLRAGTFIFMGLSGVIPVMHYVITDGWYHAFYKCSMGWLFLMAVLYIGGALIYAVRIPERLFPGKFDIWGQSHQIFHICVVAAAFVHYHGITQVANYRLAEQDCTTPLYTIEAT